MSNKIVLVFLIVGIFFGDMFGKKFLNSKKIVSNQKVTVLLDWFPNTNHTGLYVAKEKGYFDREQLDVSILQPAEGENTQAIAAGKADFAVSSQESVTLARAQKIPLVSVAAVIQHNTSAFASLVEAEIKTVKDFEGKRYGGWGSLIEETVIKAVMEDEGGNYSLVKNITIGETDFFKTIGKDSDFQWIFYGWDVIEAKRRGIQLNTILLKDLNPILDYYTPVIITNEDHVKNKKELVNKFMKAVKEGYEFSIKYPNDAALILIKSAPEINTALVKESQSWLSKEYQADAKSWGIQKGEVWKRYAQWLFDRKLIKNMINEHIVFTNEFLQ
jgi:ABC-type nitrate/sulfonate/bicarbonate transport system substrate-binding protein